MCGLEDGEGGGLGGCLVDGCYGGGGVCQRGDAGGIGFVLGEGGDVEGVDLVEEAVGDLGHLAEGFGLAEVVGLEFGGVGEELGLLVGFKRGRSRVRST